MKLNSMFSAMLLVACLALFNSCSDDETPSEVFKFDGQTISLKGSKIYLTYESSYNNHTYRDYFISDGEYTNADGDNGWSIDDYTGATYYLALELAVPDGDDFAAGQFPQLSSWGSMGADDQVSYIYLEEEDETEYYTDDENEDTSPVVVKGGFDDGDKMTLKFSGKLSYYYDDPEDGWIEVPVSGNFYFSGTVEDHRDM